MLSSDKDFILFVIEMLPQAITNTGEMKKKIEYLCKGIKNLSREIEDIKKDQWKFRTAEYIIQKKKPRGWAQQQNGGNRGKNQ